VPLNGSGGVTQPTGSIYPATANTLIESAKANTSIADIYTILGSAIYKDGQQVTTARIPFASGIQTDTVTEKTSDTGVTLDSVLLKDGRIDTTQGADIASAATVNLETATGNVVDVTGTTTITAVTLSQGHWRLVRFTGALTLTNGASLVLPNAVDYTTAAGDYVLFVGYAASVVRAYIFPTSGPIPFVDTQTIVVGSADKTKKIRVEADNLSTATTRVLTPMDKDATVAPAEDITRPFNVSLAASVASNILTIALKTRDGGDPSAGDPAFIPFRNATATTGDYEVVKQTAALSIAIPDTATLGTVNADMARLYVYAVNDGGTLKLGVYNPVSGSGNTVSLKSLNVGDVQSSTVIGVGADSAQTLYTDTAGVTSKAICWLGFVEIVEATAGTWATSPSLVTLAGNGVKYTGDLVQAVNAISAGSTTTSSTDADVTNATVSITPSSRCNLLECHVDYRQVCANQTATTAGSTATVTDATPTAYRTAKTIKGTNTTSEIIVQACGSFHFYAKPDSTAAQTVKLQHASVNNSDSITTDDVGIVVKEIFA
jgi:hypothetical protein